MAFISKQDLQSLAEMRLQDAVILLQAGRYSSAYYLSGYAVELGLKACIAKAFQQGMFPDKGFVNKIFSHKLDELVRLASLTAGLEEEQKINKKFNAYWGIVSQWSEESRYEVIDQFKTHAIIGAIHDPKDGVFQWLKKFW